VNHRSLALASICGGLALLASCDGQILSPASTTGAAGMTGGSRTIGSGGAPNGGATTGSAGSAPATGRGGTTGNAGTAPTTGRGGSTGVTGLAGTTGSAGGTGAAGAMGAAGATGSAGSTNGTGRAGTTGSAGTTGVAGSGKAGTTGVAGTTGTAGTNGAAGSGGTGGSTTTAAGTIVPLYTDPGDPSWTKIVEAKTEHPTVHVVAIVNPSDGPGSSLSSAYTNGIAKLVAAGIQVIGYVATGYAGNPIASMESTIDRWKSFYPQLEGIFFDEQSNQARDVAYYQTLSQYAKAKGLSYTVGNPGTDTDEAFVGALDTMLIYETDGVPSVSQMAGWHTKYPRANFGVIPYKVPAMNAAFVSTARQYVGYIYLQSDDLPNPWDSLPSYFSDLLAALE